MTLVFTYHDDLAPLNRLVDQLAAVGVRAVPAASACGASGAGPQWCDCRI